MYAEVTIAARNGGVLADPAHILVSLDRAVEPAVRAAIEQLVRQSVEESPGFADRFLSTDLLARFRGGDQP